MHFLYPAFLYALGLIAIPILIHLFNFRRYKKVVFSDIRFLKELTEQNKKQQSIKQWLILLCRVLAIAFLVFAFAQPFTPSNENSKLNQAYWVSVFVDNSFSMQANTKEGSLLDQAKKKAIEIANSYKETDQFQLLTNDFEGKHQRLVSKKDFLELVSQVQESSAHKNFSEVLKRQESIGAQVGSGKGQFYWVSDFQKNMAPTLVQPDSTASIFLVPLKGELNQNTWIDTAWFAEPILKKGAQNKLFVRIKNESEADFNNQPIVLKIDGTQKSIQNISCPSGEKTTLEMRFTLPDYAWHDIELGLTDYPIVFDDKYFLAAKAKEFVHVLHIKEGESSNLLAKVYSLDPFYEYKESNIKQLNFEDFPKQAAIVLNEPKSISSGLNAELVKFVKGGGVLFFIPSPSPTDILSIQTFLNSLGVQYSNFSKQISKVNRVETKDPIFENVFSKIPELANLPSNMAYWQMSGTNQSFRNIITLSNDLPFLARTKLGLGSAYFLSASLQPEGTDFGKQSLFVPFMLNLPLQSGIKQYACFNLGEQSQFTFEAQSVQKVVQLKLGKQEHLVEVSVKDKAGFGKLNGQIQQAGVYSLHFEKTEWAKIAFNYPRTESVQGYIDTEDFAKKIGAKELGTNLSGLKSQLEKEIQGTHYWQWALLLALLFLVLEMLLIRGLKFS
ncbi:MAG: hypothetical protein CFE21_14500 [Bacteroidetes bacterium B1(2017)]|nr:MAG: hypothetical protein CFE21_14500 [Bacteroidetes bacterium B1(2017)]